LFGGFEGPPLTLPELLTDIVSKKMKGRIKEITKKGSKKDQEKE
jgi:hypothetical protein